MKLPEQKFRAHVRQCPGCQAGTACAAGKQMITDMCGDDDGQITASAAASEIEALDGVLPTNIQWMPPGHQVVQPLGFEEPFEMKVTPAIAAAADRQLQQLISKARSGQDAEPYGDANHKDEGRMFKPKRFFWGGEDPKDGGVRMEVEWLPAGAKAVLDGALCCVSPQWILSKTSKAFLGITHNVGGLVPRSAFHSIQAFAKADSSQPQTKPQIEPMLTKEDQDAIAKLVADAIAANNTTLEAKAKGAAAVTAQAGAGNSNIITLDAVKAAITDAVKPLNTKLESFETREQEGRVARAKAAVQVHVQRGAIAPEEKLPSGKLAVDYYADAYLASAADAEAAMSKLPSKRPQRIITSPAGATQTATSAMEPEQRILAKAKGDKGLSVSSLEAYMSTPEGRADYENYRNDIIAGAERFPKQQAVVTGK